MIAYPTTLLVYVLLNLYGAHALVPALTMKILTSFGQYIGRYRIHLTLSLQPSDIIGNMVIRMKTWTTTR